MALKMEEKDEMNLQSSIIICSNPKISTLIHDCLSEDLLEQDEKIFEDHLDECVYCQNEFEDWLSVLSIVYAETDSKSLANVVGGQTQEISVENKMKGVNLMNNRKVNKAVG